jgi:CrcB protein
VEPGGIARPMPSYDVRELAAIFAGGAVGALARAGIASAAHWPWATFVVNIAGAFCSAI